MKTKIVALIAAIAFFAVTISPYTFAGKKNTKKSNKVAIEKVNANQTASDSTKVAPKKLKKVSKKAVHHKKHTSKKSSKVKTTSKTKHSKTHKMAKGTTATK